MNAFIAFVLYEFRIYYSFLFTQNADVMGWGEKRKGERGGFILIVYQDNGDASFSWVVGFGNNTQQESPNGAKISFGKI